MTRRRWTDDDDRALIEGAGAFGLQWFFARLLTADGKSRTRQALYHRARKLWGPGGMRRGVFSLRAIALSTGYHPDQIRRAQAALNQRFKRLSARGAYLVSYDQREDVLAWLAKDYWSKPLRVYNCLWCATVERPHHGVGLCGRCYKAMVRLCCRLGVPHGCEELLAWLELHPQPPEVALVLQGRLARGWCLEAAQLALLAASVAHSRGKV